MIRICHVYFPGRTLLLAASELIVLLLASLVAAFAVFGADAGTVILDPNEFLKLPLVVGICMALMHYFDLYDSMVLFNTGQATVRVIQVLGTACVILACLYYVYPSVQINPNLLMAWVAVAGVSLFIWRRVFLALNQSPRHAQKTLLLGTGPLAVQLVQEIESRPELGLDLAGYLDPERVFDGRLHKLEHLGGPDNLGGLLTSHEIQRVIVASEDKGGRPTIEALQMAKSRGILVDEGPELYEAIAARIYLNSLRPSMLLFYEGFRFRPFIKLYKRTASVVLSFVGLILFAPVMLAIAIAIRFDSRGPIIFRQKRAGKDGRPFTLYKFRSMYDGADADGKSRPAELGDLRCTRMGRWLRRTRLDELPQLYNILRGDMHFIGPRPFAVDEEEHLSHEIPFYTHRWAVRPGATGWAQVRKGYNETISDNVEKLAYDLYYIKHLSVGLDLLIVFESIKILLLGRGAR